MFFAIYRWLVWPLLSIAFQVLGRFNSKITKGLELRAKVDGRAPWTKLLPPSPPTVWFHCASGEFEYAKPVITLLKAQLPQVKVVVTFFSPTYADNIRKFSGVDWCPAPSGAPVLEGVSAWVDCTLWAEYDGGDHTIVVGNVHDLGSDPTTLPLLFYRGAYGINGR